MLAKFSAQGACNSIHQSNSDRGARLKANNVLRSICRMSRKLMRSRATRSWLRQIRIYVMKGLKSIDMLFR